MANQFSIQPASTTGLLKGLYGGMQAQRENKAKAQDQAKQQALTAQAQELFRAGDLGAIAEFSIANPELGERINEGVGFRSDETKAVRGKIMGEIMSGGDPYAAINAGAKRIAALGGDPSDMIKLLELSPEEIVAKTGPAMAMQFPGESKNLKAFNEKKFAQASGEGMQGWAFDESTGEFSLDPVYQKFLQSDAGRLAGKDMLTPKDVSGINDKVTVLVKEATDIRSAALSLEELSKNPTQPAVIAAIFKFMKALDPDSAVRENEVGMIEGAEGAAQGIANMFNRMMGEGGMSASGFAEIVRVAKVLSNSSIMSSEVAVRKYTDVMADNLTGKQLNNLRGRVPVAFELKSPPPSIKEGATATNGQGQKIIYKGGKWEPVQ